MNQHTLSSTGQLLALHCAPQTTALNDIDVAQLLPLIPGWALADGKINCSFGFHNYYQTLAFVNALAWIIHEQDHHPELTITYKTCTVKFDTHSVNSGRGGLSENDFICAAKTSALYQDVRAKPVAPVAVPQA